MKKIAIVGPESTGKSTLCEGLARSYNVSWIPEFSREFLNKLSRPYIKKDLLFIATKQFEITANGVQENGDLLISDTEVLTIKIWSQVKYGYSDDRIEKLLNLQKFDLYLLCDTDIPWHKDPLREVPNLEDRRDIFTLFKSEMDRMNWKYQVVSGNQFSRLNSSKKIIDSL